MAKNEGTHWCYLAFAEGGVGMVEKARLMIKALVGLSSAVAGVATSLRYQVCRRVTI
jgi:hypothetical protein